MSDQTKAALDAAISAHIADTFPGYYTSGWVVITSSTALDRPDATNYRIMSPNGQPFHTDLGLINVGRLIMNDAWDEEADDEDDD